MTEIPASGGGPGTAGANIDGMRTTLWVAAGGAGGTLARYAISRWIAFREFPWATLGINLSGALILGVLLTVVQRRGTSDAVTTPLAVGVLGGYTTFSTFAWEGFTLIDRGRPVASLLYMSVSVVGGVAAAWLGYVFGRG